AVMLAALEKRDAEAYNLLKARQDVRLSRASIRLQDLRVAEAQGGVDLAKLQRDRAQKQEDHFEEMLKKPINDDESRSLVLLGLAALTYTIASVAAYAKWWDMKQEQGFGYSGQAFSTTASILSQRASYERRKQDWELQKTLAKQDVKIGAQQVK